MTLRKVRLEAGPLAGRIALATELKPELHFRCIGDDGTERKVIYRQKEDSPTLYVYESEHPTDAAE
jgi:hypothetical protein